MARRRVVLRTQINRIEKIAVLQHSLNHGTLIVAGNAVGPLRDLTILDIQVWGSAEALEGLLEPTERWARIRVLQPA